MPLIGLQALMERIDRLPSAKLFLDWFSQSTVHPAVQLFSGEGESLILAAWLQHHGLTVDGIMLLGDYGVQWGIHQEAQRRWGILTGTQHDLDVITYEGSPGDLWDFQHQLGIFFSPLGNAVTKVIYDVDQHLQDAVKGKQILMGFRCQDIFRHLKKEGGFAAQQMIDVANLLECQVRCGGGPGSIWWPFWDMDTAMKEVTLDELNVVHGLFHDGQGDDV